MYTTRHLEQKEVYYYCVFHGPHEKAPPKSLESQNTHMTIIMHNNAWQLFSTEKCTHHPLFKTVANFMGNVEPFDNKANVGQYYCVPVTIKCDIIDFTAWLFEVHKLDDMVGIKCGMWMSTAVFVTTQLNLVVRRFGCMKWMPHPVMFMLELNTTLQKLKLNWVGKSYNGHNGFKNQGVSEKSQPLRQRKTWSF